MAKNTIVQYSTTAGSNTDIQSVNIDEGCPPSGINNAIREVMVDLAELSAGTQSLANLKTTATTQIAAGAVGAPSLSFSADTNTGIWQSAADTLSVSAGGTEKFRVGDTPYAGHNLLDNGDMSIFQRAANIDIDNANLMTLDLWRVRDSAGGSVQVGESTDVPTSAEAGTSRSKFSKSLYVNCTGATGTLGANDFAYVSQTIEGQFLQDLGYGAAGAKPVTLSFWCKTNKTGQCGVQLFQEDGGRHYSSNYTVSGTGWEFHTVTFPGDSSGQIDNDTGGALTLRFCLATGSNYHATAGSWTAGTKFGASGDNNQLDDAANDWRITGVKLEVGSVATDYVFRPGGELAACQRYLYRIQRTSAVNIGDFAVGFCNSTTIAYFLTQFPVMMRAEPTQEVSATNDFTVRVAGSGIVTTNARYVGGSQHEAFPYFDVSSGFTAGGGAMVTLTSNNDWIQWSAEI